MSTLTQSPEEVKNSTIENVKNTKMVRLMKLMYGGNKKLAYQINNKKKEGFYVVVPFKASTELPKELDRRLQ